MAHQRDGHPIVESPGSKTSDIALDVQDLHKSFGAVHALRGLSFQVARGQVFSILGPNGAGKTTLLKILMTLTRPDLGSAYVLGRNVLTNPQTIRQQLGVVAQENHFEPYFSIEDNLRLHAELHGMAPRDYRPRIEALLKAVDLWDRRQGRHNQLSGGMQRRVALVRALVHQPKLLFLDEPTTGLDPQARRQLWDTIRSIQHETTVVLTTHYMEEADVLSDEILMLNHGTIVMQGTPQALKQAISPKNRFELQLKLPVAETVINRLSQLVQSSAHTLEWTIVNPYRIELTLYDNQCVHAVLNAVEGQEFYRLGALESDLEDVFLSVLNSATDGPKEKGHE